MIRIRRPDPQITARSMREAEVLAAALLLRDAAAVVIRLDVPAVRGLYAGAVERLEDAALRLPGDETADISQDSGGVSKP